MKLSNHLELILNTLKLGIGEDNLLFTGTLSSCGINIIVQSIAQEVRQRFPAGSESGKQIQLKDR